MRIAFNTEFMLPCLPNRNQAIRVQGYELRAVADQGRSSHVQMQRGQVFSASLIPNPLGHDAPWLALDNTPEGVIIGSAMGAIVDWGDLVVITTDSGEVISR